MAEATRATVIGAVLRPLAIVVGGTFAIDRLAQRLGDAPTDDGYPAALLDAIQGDPVVREAIGETARLALPAALLGVALGVLAAAVARLRDGRRRAGPGRGMLAGAVLAVAVPGLAWIPLERALGPGAGAGPTTAVGGLASPDLVRWVLLVALAVGPPVAVALDGRRRWAAVTATSSVASGQLLVTEARRRLRLGLPLLTFALSLATAEVLAANGGLVDRFVSSMEQGRPDDLVPLALPVIAVGAAAAVVADLAVWWARRRRPLQPLAEPPSRSGPRPPRFPLAALNLGLAVLSLAVIGTILASRATPIDDPLQAPRLGGPWFGTDAQGRGLAVQSGAALGLTLAASAIPAIVATAVGSGLAAFRRALGRKGREVVGALLDLLSWPPALVVSLAAWGVGPTAQPLLHPIVLQVMGLLLVPSAARLLAAAGTGWRARLAGHVGTAGLLTALAFAVHLFAGFVAPAGTDDTSDLGRLVADGLAVYDESVWPVLVPLVAAVAAAMALSWLVAPLAAVDRRPTVTPSPTEDLTVGSTDGPTTADAALETAVEPDVEPTLDEPTLEPALANTTDDADRTAILDEGVEGPAAANEDEPVAGPDDGSTTDDGPIVDSPDLDSPDPDSPDPDSPDPDEPGIDEPDRPAVVLLGDVPRAERQLDERDIVRLDGEPIVERVLGDDIRDDVSVASAVDIPPPGDADDDARAADDHGDGDGDDVSIVDDATRTVELRPADLRRAGLRPPSEE